MVRRFRKHVRQQVRKLKRTYAAAAHGNDKEAVHDLRVATRRLQTILELATFSKPMKSARKARKRLKQLRHVLSARRDIDVLVQTMRSRARTAASAHRRRLWNRAARETRNQGQREAKKTRRWLKSFKLNRLTGEIEKIVDGRLNDGFSSGTLSPAMRRAQQRWNQAVREASAGTDSARFHAVRIKTKSLRYMTELISELIGSERSKGLIEWLGSIQDELGEWRDQTELCRRLTAVLNQDAALQADPVATAMIDSARRRTRHNDEHARHIIESLRTSGARKQIAAVAKPSEG
ncbi:MAG TPA: CHAD domain-containing protein [Candidatus Binataceae bacterium]